MSNVSSMTILRAGTFVRVKPGVRMPEYPSLDISGWTGHVHQLVRKPAHNGYLIEWDEPTLAAIPAEYIRKCDERGLLHDMAFLKKDQIEPIESR